MERVKAETAKLWIGLLAGPAAWAVQLQTVYTLAPWSCDHSNLLPLHLVTSLCLAGAIGGGWLAWKKWQEIGGWPGGDEDVDSGRVRLMSVVGIMSSALFALVILAQWFAVVMLDPCPR